MKNILNRGKAGLLCVAMIGSMGLAGCAAVPKDTAALLELHNKAEAAKCGTVSGNFDINLNAKSGEEAMDVTADMKYLINWSIDKTAYAKFDAKITGLDDAGMSTESEESATMETYVRFNENAIQAWYRVDGSDWEYETSELDAETIEQLNSSFSSTENLDITGEFTKEDNAYVVTQTFAAIFASEQYKNMMDELSASVGEMVGGENPDFDIRSELDEVLGEVGTSMNDIETQLGKGTIKYSFDKKSYYLTGLDISGVSYSLNIPGEDESDAIDISMSLSSQNILSNYNALEESDYTVPDEVYNLFTYDDTESTDSAGITAADIDGLAVG